MRIDLQGSINRIINQFQIITPCDNPIDLGGNLNHVFILKAKNGEQYILRIPKLEYRHSIRDYLFQLYKTAGFVKKGNEFFFRPLEHQAIFSYRCRSMDIFVPDILFVGDNFLLTRFIEGIPYNIVLRQSCRVISPLFTSVIQSHRKGIIFGDRWGGNELIVGNKVCFLDFDIGYAYKNKHEFQLSKNFELAVLVYGSILHCSKKSESVQIFKKIFEKIQPEYNLECVIGYLNGYMKFYSNPLKPTTNLSLSLFEYQQTNYYVTELIRLLECMLSDD